MHTTKTVLSLSHLRPAHHAYAIERRIPHRRGRRQHPYQLRRLQPLVLTLLRLRLVLLRAPSGAALHTAQRRRRRERRGRVVLVAAPGQAGVEGGHGGRVEYRCGCCRIVFVWDGGDGLVRRVCVRG